MKQDAVFGLLGLSQRAGKVTSGEFSVDSSVRDGKSYLVILAGDTSDRSKKQFKDMCEHFKVPYREYSDKETLGHAIGKEFRASLSVNDEGLARQIISKIDGGSN